MMELAETADIAAQRPSTSDAKDRSSDELGRRLPTELFAIPTDFGTLLYAPLGRRLSVSYTHLDVYKRQLL